VEVALLTLTASCPQFTHVQTGWEDDYASGNQKHPFSGDHSPDRSDYSQGNHDPQFWNQR
jgi:hypothetical protein